MPTKTKKGLLEQATAVEVLKPEKGDRPELPPSRKINVPSSRLAEFATAIETQFPDAVINENAIAKGGVLADGETQIVTFAVIQRNPNGTASVYHTGKGSLSGELCGLDWA